LSRGHWLLVIVDTPANAIETKKLPSKPKKGGSKKGKKGKGKTVQRDDSDEEKDGHGDEDEPEKTTSVYFLFLLLKLIISSYTLGESIL
jgi:hypothetical protein